MDTTDLYLNLAYATLASYLASLGLSFHHLLNGDNDNLTNELVMRNNICKVVKTQ